MRTQEEIDKVLSVISETWKNNPTLRLCQLLGNCLPEPAYYLEDDVVVEKIKHLYGRHLTPIEVRKYIDDPNACPYCYSHDITAYPIDFNDMTSFVRCGSCGRSWHDGYSLTSIFEGGD